MVSSSFIEPLAKGYLLMTNILSTVRIDKLTVPEVVASDCDASLECAYAGTAAGAGDVTVRWLLNGSQVYEWTEGQEPVASGLLADRVDLSYRTSARQVVQRHNLRLMALTPELSGEYTCVVQSRGQDARMTKTMIIFSPEREFELTLTRVAADLFNVKCVAKHLYPRPELTIEYNKVAVGQQQQRAWRLGAHYEAECAAVLAAVDSAPAAAEVACRLRIPQVDYTAITKKYVHFGNQKNGAFILNSDVFRFTLAIVLLTNTY